MKEVIDGWLLEKEIKLLEGCSYYTGFCWQSFTVWIFLLPQDHFLCIIFPKPWAQVWILMYYHCLSKHIHEEMIQENDCGELTLAKLETAMSINIKWLFSELMDSCYQ